MNRKSGNLHPGWERELRRLRFIKRIFSVSVVMLIGLTGLVLWLFFTYSPPPPVKPAAALWPWETVMDVQRAGGRRLGDFVRDRYPETRILLLVPPPAAPADIEAATLEGLLTGLEGHGGEVRTEPVGDRGEAGDEGNGEDYFWFDAAAFDAAVAAHPEADIVISLMGLPLYPQRMRFWQLRPRPKLMLINAEIFRLARLIADGAVEAVATRDPGYAGVDPEAEGSDPEDLWLIITADNVRELQLRHPNLFVPEDAVGDVID